jgi:hypothetical protein
MAQPHNPARDTSGLPAAVPRGFQYRDHWYPDDQHFIKYLHPGSFTPLERHHRLLQRQDRIVPGR